MPNKNEDKLFKNINDEDARTLLNIIDIESVEVKVWTKELRIRSKRLCSRYNS